MFYRLVQGGILPAWFGLHGPVTYLLEPGLILGESTHWTKTLRTTVMSENAFLALVQRTLETMYQKPNWGYSVYGAKDSTPKRKFATLGRFVPVGAFPRLPADRYVKDWRAASNDVLAGTPSSAGRTPRSHYEITPPDDPKRGAENFAADDGAGTPSRPPKRRKRNSSVS